MSKINAIRLINLNYNYNTIKIDDEYFELDGENSLFSLMNGGGKSVIVQMVTAPFVHKRYRDAEKRLFNSYFTTNKPTFILVEWKLDGNAGYVLTGMMVRKNQDTESDTKAVVNDLDIISFIYEYKAQNQYDIRRLPVIEEINNKKQLKGYQTCEKLFEEIRLKIGNVFSLFNLNMQTQQKQYFEKLEQYQIYSSEWESIIKKINIKESGLSELFSTAQNEKGLLEKWFLKSIEDKLNKNGDRTKKFEDIISKCIKSYKDNASKLEKRDCIASFKTETEAIYTSASKFQSVIIERKALESRIGALIVKLSELNKQSQLEMDDLNEKLNEAKTAIIGLKYQEASLRLIEKKEKLVALQKSLEDIYSQIAELGTQKSSIEKYQNILKCAKIFKRLNEKNNEIKEYEAKLDLLNKKNNNLKPKREQLGYTLKCYYENEVKKQEIAVQDIIKEINCLKNDIEHITKQLASLRDEQERNNRAIGKIEAEIKFYNNEENIFNNKYNKSLSRNLLGMYEDGMLERLMLQYKNENEGLKQGIIDNKRKKYELEKEQTAVVRQSEDNQSIIVRLGLEHKALVDKLSSFDEQLENRKIALKYINVAEDKIFDASLILTEFKKKITEIEGLKFAKVRELEDLDKEYKKLETGKILELSYELEDALNTAGIKYVFDMSWLKQNGYAKDKNEQLLKDNPLIPYSLIMSKSEIAKLNNSNINAFTSAPVPIVIRESLDALDNSTSLSSKVYNCDSKISFYVLFNQELLDNERLQKLLAEKALAKKELTKTINDRAEEIDFYTNKKGQIENQTVKLSDYNECKELIEKTGIELECSNKEKILLKAKLSDINNQSSSIVEELIKLNQLAKESDNMISDFTSLGDAYSEYLSQMDEKQYIAKECEKIDADISQLANDKDNKQKLIQEKLLQNNIFNNKLDAVRAKKSKFSSYNECDRLTGSIEQLEIEFDAITSEIDIDQKNIGINLSKVKIEFENINNELNRATVKYDIVENEYVEIEFDSFYEDNLEQQQKDIEKRILEINTIEKRLIKERAELSTNIQNDLEKTYNNFGYKEILPKQKIIVIDFKKEILTLELQGEEYLKQLNIQKDRNSLYNNNLGLLEEYNQFVQYAVNNIDSIINTIEYYSEAELNNYRGELKRDYKAKIDEETKAKQGLSDEINRIISLDIFKDEFYYNPLKNLFDCRTTPTTVIEQLDLTWKSYGMLLKKLQVDIEKLEDEKASIISMLTEYINDIYKNLDMIDRNSSISIRNRSIKMLRIKQPIWEDEEATYTIRIRDFVDELIKLGIELLQNNEQIEEMLGKRITICNLYDYIIGCSRVEIKLYKIEAQNQIPITWAEAAKNSGGEGFLSAFVILSSLMMYLRRDETDIFLEKEEGKVLIMDNPFAQTNAEHLLKPLMDIAKKSNTQLICLTGLGGDSIYNRFDNIYVLNLVMSKMQSGVRYLRSEHAKGEENMKDIVASHILAEDVEQLTIF